MSYEKDLDEPHWVERLFPPAFTLDDVEKAATESPGELTLDSRLRHFSLDSTMVRAIYERVLLMEKARAAEDKVSSHESAKTLVLSKNHQQQQQRNPLPPANLVIGQSASPHYQRAKSQSVHLEEGCCSGAGCSVESRMRKDDSATEHTCCPWTSAELNKLRMARRSQDDELSELRLRLAQLEKDTAQERQAAAAVARERDDLIARGRSLASRERRAEAAWRSLAAALEVERRAAAERDATVTALLQQVAYLESELADSRAEVGRLRAATARAEANADIVVSRAAAEAEAANEAKRQESDARFARISSELRAAQEEVSLERAAHDRSKMALERLVLHFSVSQESVKDDESVLRVQY